MEIVFCPLFSGSDGNALYVQCGDTRLLIDAGKSGKVIGEAMASIGADPAELDGILITHEHSDHISSAGILSRRYHLPIYATEGTWRGMESKLGRIAPENRCMIDADSDFYIGQLGIQTFSIPHDAEEPVGYRLWNGNISVSTATDMGYFSQRVMDAVSGSSLVLLESNHDPDMLMANDHYSAALKKRILGKRGHLSNETCAEALVQLVETGVRNVVLGHLSGENNRPRLALETSENRVELEGMRLGTDVSIDLAWRDRVGNVYTISDTGLKL